jgi:hypothetical protein
METIVNHIKIKKITLVKMFKIAHRIHPIIILNNLKWLIIIITIIIITIIR